MIGFGLAFTAAIQYDRFYVSHSSCHQLFISFLKFRGLGPLELNDYYLWMAEKNILISDWSREDAYMRMNLWGEDLVHGVGVHGVDRLVVIFERIKFRNTFH